MWAHVVCYAALMLGADAQSIVGTIRVAGTAEAPVVSVAVDNATTEDKVTDLSGDLVVELMRLASFKVEVIGLPDPQKPRAMVVKHYRIVDIGGGARPIVGHLVATGDRLALADGDGEPIPLNLAGRTRQRLMKSVGAKIWIFGKQLLSGEVKVQRYGILREVESPPAKSDPAPTKPADAQP